MAQQDQQIFANTYIDSMAFLTQAYEMKLIEVKLMTKVRQLDVESNYYFVRLKWKIFVTHIFRIVCFNNQN